MASRGEGGRGRGRSRTRTPTAVTQKPTDTPVAQRSKVQESDRTPTTKKPLLQSDESEPNGKDEAHNVHNSRNLLLGKSSPRSTSPRSNSSRSSSPRAQSRTTRPETNRLGIFEKLEKIRKDSPQRETEEDSPQTKSYSEKVSVPTDLQLVIPSIPKDLPFGKVEADPEKSKKRGRKSLRKEDQTSKNASVPDNDNESHQVQMDRRKTGDKQSLSNKDNRDEGVKPCSLKKRGAKRDLREPDQTDAAIAAGSTIQDVPKVKEYVVRRNKSTGVKKAVEKPPSHNTEDDRTLSNSASECQSNFDRTECTIQSAADITQENGTPDTKVAKGKEDVRRKKYTSVKKTCNESPGSKAEDFRIPSSLVSESQINLDGSECTAQLVNDVTQETDTSQIKVYTSLSAALQNLPRAGKKPVVTLPKVKMQPSDIKYVHPESISNAEDSASMDEEYLRSSAMGSSTEISQEKEECTVEQADSKSISNAKNSPEMVVESPMNQSSKGPHKESKRMSSKTLSDKMDSLIQNCLKGKMENAIETMNGPRCSPRARKQTSIIEDYLASRKAKNNQCAKTDGQGETSPSSGLVFNRTKSRRTYSSNILSEERDEVDKETDIGDLPKEYLTSQRAPRENDCNGGTSELKAKMEDKNLGTLSGASPVNHSLVLDTNGPQEDDLDITVMEESSEGQLSLVNTKKQSPNRHLLIGHKKTIRRKQSPADLQKNGGVGQPNVTDTSPVKPGITFNDVKSSKVRAIPKWKSSQFDAVTLQNLKKISIDLVLAGTSPISQTVLDSKNHDTASELVPDRNPKHCDTPFNIPSAKDLENDETPSELSAEKSQTSNNAGPLSIDDINIDLVLTGTMDVKQKKGRPRGIDGSEVLVMSKPSKDDQEGEEEGDEVMESVIIQSPVRSRSGRAIKLTSAAIEAGLAHESSMSFLVGTSGTKEKVKSIRCLDFSPERSCSSRDTSPDKGQTTSDTKIKGKKRTKKTQVDESSPTISTPTLAISSGPSPSSDRASPVISSVLCDSGSQNTTTSPSQDIAKVSSRKKSPPKKRTIREILNITEEDLNVEMPPLAKTHDQVPVAVNTSDKTHVSEKGSLQEEDEEDNLNTTDSKDELNSKTVKLGLKNDEKADKLGMETNMPPSNVKEDDENILAVQEIHSSSKQQDQLAKPYLSDSSRTEEQTKSSATHCEKKDVEIADSICCSSKVEEGENDCEEYAPVELIEADGKKNQFLFSLISQITDHMKPDSTALPPIEMPPTDDDEESVLLGAEPDSEGAKQHENETDSSSNEEEASASESDDSDSDDDSDGDGEEISTDNESSSSDLGKIEPNIAATEVEESEGDEEMKIAAVEEKCKSVQKTEKSLNEDANVSINCQPCETKLDIVAEKEQSTAGSTEKEGDHLNLVNEHGKLSPSVSASEHTPIEKSVKKENNEIPLEKTVTMADVLVNPPSLPASNSVEKPATAEGNKENNQNSLPSSPDDFSLEDPEERLRFLEKQLKQLDSFIPDTIQAELPKKDKQTDGEYKADLSRFKIEEEAHHPEGGIKEQVTFKGEFSQQLLPSTAVQSSAGEVSEENVHKIFEKPGPANKKKASAFLSNELDEYLTKNCKLNQKCQGSFKQEVCTTVASEDTVQHSTPDVDMVDDFIFYSFSSQHALEDYTKRGEFLSTPTIGTHSTMRKELLEPPPLSISGAASDDYKTPEKTRDITKIKGWKKKFSPGEEPQRSEPQKSEPQKSEPQKSEPQKSEPQMLQPEKVEPQMLQPEKPEPQRLTPVRPNGPTVSPTPEGAINSLLKIHWRTKERLLRNLTPDEITILGLSLKQRRRRFKQFTHRKNKKSKTQVGDNNADNFEGRMRPPIMPPKKRLRPAVLTSSMVMSAMSALRIKSRSRGFPYRCPEEACRLGCICQNSDSSDVAYLDSDEMSSTSIDPPPPLPQCGKEYCRLGCLCNLIEEARGSSSTQDDSQSESWHQDKSNKDTDWEGSMGIKKKGRKRKLQFNEENPIVEESKGKLMKEKDTGKEEVACIKKEIKDDKHDHLKSDETADATSSPPLTFQGSYLSMFGLGKKSEIKAATESKENSAGKVRKSSRLKDRTGIGHIDKLQDLIYFDATQWADIGQKKKVKKEKEVKSPKQESIKGGWVTGLGNKHGQLGKQKYSAKPGSPLGQQMSHPELLRVQAPELAGQLQASGGFARSRPIIQQTNPIEIIDSDDEDQSEDDNNERTMVCARTSIYTVVQRRPLISSQQQYPIQRNPQSQSSVISKGKSGKVRPSFEKLQPAGNIPSKVGPASNQPKPTAPKDEKSNEMQNPLKIRKQMVLLQRNHARQSGKDKKPPGKVIEIKPEIDDRPPHLLEIQSDCNWHPIRSHLLNQISIIADRDDLPPSGHKLCRRVGDFIVEIRPPSKEPTQLPPNLQSDTCKSLLAIRIVITQDSKQSNASVNTPQDTKKPSASQVVPRPVPGSQGPRIHTMYPPGSETMRNKSPGHVEATSRVMSPAVTAPAVTAPMGLSALSKLNINAPGCVKQGEGSFSVQSRGRFASFSLASGKFVAGDGSKLYSVADSQTLTLPKTVQSKSNEGEGAENNPGPIRLSTPSNLDIQDLSDALKSASIPMKRKHSLSESSDEKSAKHVCRTSGNPSETSEPNKPEFISIIKQQTSMQSGKLSPSKMSADVDQVTTPISAVGSVNNASVYDVATSEAREEVCTANPFIVGSKDDAIDAISVSEAEKNIQTTANSHTAGSNTGTGTLRPEMNHMMSMPSFMNTVISPTICATRPSLGTGMRRGPGPRLRMPVMMNACGRIMGPRGMSSGPRIRIPLSMLKSQTQSAGATPQPITYNLASSAPNRTGKSSQAGSVMVAPVAVRMPLPAEHAITKVNTNSQGGGHNDIPAGSPAPNFVMSHPVSAAPESASTAQTSSGGTAEIAEELSTAKLPSALPAQGYTMDIGRNNTDGAESNDSYTDAIVSKDIVTDASESSSQVRDDVANQRSESASDLRLIVSTDEDNVCERNGGSSSSRTKVQDEQIISSYQSKDEDTKRASESNLSAGISNDESPVVILSDDSEESDIDIMSPEDGKATAAQELRGHRDDTREEHLQRMLSYKSRQRPNTALGMMSQELRQHLLQGSQAAHRFKHGPIRNQKIHKHTHRKDDEMQEACDDSETGEENGSLDGSSRDALSRKQHLHRERLRRSDITLKFDKLKAVIPDEYIKGITTNQSKNAILSGARKYIAYQRKLNSRQEKERELLLQQRVNLIERLKALKYAPHRCMPPASYRLLKSHSVSGPAISATPEINEQQTQQAIKRRAKGQWGPASKRKQLATGAVTRGLPVSDTSADPTPGGSNTSTTRTQETTEPSFTITAVRSLATSVSKTSAGTPLSSSSPHSSLDEDVEQFLSGAEDDSNDYLSSRSQSTNNDE